MNGPGRLLEWTRRLLPPGLAEWGQAMSAELVAVPQGWARWRFAAGCLRVALTRPALLGRWAWRAFAALPCAVAVGWIAQVGYEPLRYGAFGVVAGGIAVLWLSGRMVRAWGTRLVRLLGVWLVVAEGLLVLHGLTATGDPASRTAPALVVLGAALAAHLAATGAVTGRRLRRDVRLPVMAALAGLGTAIVFLVAFLTRPPLPPGPGWTMWALPVAACGAAVLTARGGVRAMVIAALCAAGLTGLVLATATEAVVQFLPHWVPDTSPGNVPALDRLANNRAAVSDHYLWLLAAGALTALAATATVQFPARRTGI